METMRFGRPGPWHYGPPLADWALPVALFAVSWLWLHRFLQRNHKGPKTWPLIGCIVEQARHFDVLHDWLLRYFRLTSTFSVPMMLINNTFTADPANVEYILKTNFSNYPKGERIHERFQEMMGDGIFSVDGEKWMRQRKVALSEFSSGKLRDYSTRAYRDHALRLVKVLEAAAMKNEEVDLQDLFMRLTLDSICKIGFGVGLGSLCPDADGRLPDVPFGGAFDRANALIIRRYVDFLWKVKRALNVGSEAELRKCVRVIESFLYGVINSRRLDLLQAAASAAPAASPPQGAPERADLLTRFMTIANEAGGPLYSDKELRDVVINFIIAGRDTTALTLSWLFSQVIQLPHVVDNILKEIAAVVATSDNYTSLSDVEEFAQLLNYQTLNRMHYLHASITEALRLFPAVPLDTKIAVADDVLPDGTKIKAGNFVSYVPYSMGRLEALWGPDANEFKPERWLKDGVFQPQSPFKLTAFQAGPRICLGKDTAYLQMKMTTVLLLKFFSFKMVEGHPLKYSMMVVLHMMHGLKAHVSLR